MESLFCIDRVFVGTGNLGFSQSKDLSFFSTCSIKFCGGISLACFALALRADVVLSLQQLFDRHLNEVHKIYLSFTKTLDN
jgi:hypothetical protein